jgi:hypothetical protein
MTIEELLLGMLPGERAAIIVTKLENGSVEVDATINRKIDLHLDSPRGYAALVQATVNREKVGKEKPAQLPAPAEPVAVLAEPEAKKPEPVKVETEPPPTDTEEMSAVISANSDRRKQIAKTNAELRAEKQREIDALRAKLANAQRREAKA